MAERDGTFLPVLTQVYQNVKRQTKRKADQPARTAPSKASLDGLDDSDLGIDLDST